MISSKTTGILIFQPPSREQEVNSRDLDALKMGLKITEEGEWVLIHNSVFHWTRYDYVFKNGVTQWLLLWISPEDCVNTVLNVEFEQQWQPQREWGGQNNNRFRVAKQQVHHAFFSTFLCHDCMTLMWNCLISHFVQVMNVIKLFSNTFCKTLSDRVF